MAYMEGLAFGDGSADIRETRDGIPKYSGSVISLAEWEFKVLNKKGADLEPPASDPEQNGS